MKDTIYTITGSTVAKVNGMFLCYNVTPELVHFVRIGKRGTPLTPSPKTLMSLTRAEFDEGIKFRHIKKV